jgi:hypothetical protein
MDSVPPEASLTIDELSHLREKTEAISKFLETQVKAYLETLRVLFAPRRVFGKYVGKEDVPSSERAVQQLKQIYQEVCRSPFNLSSDLPDQPLGHLTNRPVIYPVEFTHVAQSSKESKSLLISSPVRWVLTYESDWTLSQVRQSVAGQGERRQEFLQEFLLNAIVMHLFFKAFPSIVELFSDLRYEISTETLPGLGALPFVTMKACLPSFRPADQLLLTATRFSGVPAFIELINIQSLHDLNDPMKLRLEEMLG